MSATPIEPDCAEAIRKHLRAIDALLESNGGGKAADRTWPPDRIDLDDPYWEWKKLDDASDAQSLYKRSKLHLMRHEVSLPASDCPRAPRWFSVRRIREVYGADLA